MMETKTILYVDANVRPVGISRTRMLCDAYMKAFLSAHPDYIQKHLILTEERLLPNGLEDIEFRDNLVKNHDWDHPVLRYAHDFVNADRILIGAPYWDLAFPAILKVYMEKVCVTGLTFIYEETGVRSLCKAKKLIYATTCGGYIGNANFGADYFKGLCSSLLGIPSFETIYAEGLDVIGVDTLKVIENACYQAEQMALN